MTFINDYLNRLIDAFVAFGERNGIDRKWVLRVSLALVLANIAYIITRPDVSMIDYVLLLPVSILFIWMTINDEGRFERNVETANKWIIEQRESIVSKFCKMFVLVLVLVNIINIVLTFEVVSISSFVLFFYMMVSESLKPESVENDSN